MLLAQLRDWQSRFVPHPRLLLHCRQDPSKVVVQLRAQLPPQSRPVSDPFLKPSPQAGVAHLASALHQPLRQSISFVQILPLTHLAGQVPPQSMSDSVPLSTVSVHDGCVQTLDTHHDSRQSALMPQALPLAHAVVLERQFAPPQSLSVSLWF